jgi:hypothetical protein
MGSTFGARLYARLAADAAGGVNDKYSLHDTLFSEVVWCASFIMAAMRERKQSPEWRIMAR